MNNWIYLLFSLVLLLLLLFDTSWSDVNIDIRNDSQNSLCVLPDSLEWQSSNFMHAVDLVSVSEQRRGGTAGTGGVPLQVTGAAKVLLGATREGSDAARSRSVYFVVDVEQDSAFIHWHSEYAVFLREWPSIVTAYPEAFVVVGNMKSYKLLTFRLYKISEKQVVLLKDISRQNYCVFVPFQTMNDFTLDRYTYLSLWDAHIKFLRCASGFQSRETLFNIRHQDALLAAELGEMRPLSVLVMPRGVKENLKSNDRSYPGLEPIMQWAVQHEGLVLYTDHVTDFRLQIRAIASARILVVVEGSAYLMAGSLASNTLIIVLGHQLIEQQIVFPAIAALHHYIRFSNNNTVVFCSSATEILPIILKIGPIITQAH